MGILTTLNEPAKAIEFFEAKISFTTGPVELSRMLEEQADIRIIDVRAASDYKAGHIRGAVNLPRDQWESQEALAKDKLNVVYCYSQTCHLAAAAAAKFAGKGYPVMEMEGGFQAWKDNGLEMEQ